MFMVHTNEKRWNNIYWIFTLHSVHSLKHAGILKGLSLDSENNNISFFTDSSGGVSDISYKCFIPYFSLPVATWHEIPGSLTPVFSWRKHRSSRSASSSVENFSHGEMMTERIVIFKKKFLSKIAVCHAFSMCSTVHLQENSSTLQHLSYFCLKYGNDFGITFLFTHQCVIECNEKMVGCNLWFSDQILFTLNEILASTKLSVIAFVFSIF